MTRFLLAMPLAVACLLLGACSSYVPPDLAITSATVTQRTDQGTVINFTIDADNTNAEAIPLQSVRYTVYLDGKPVFTGYRSPEATVRRFGMQQLKLPAVVPTGLGGDATGGKASYRLEGTCVYVTPGGLARILYDAEIQETTMAFSGEGELDLGSGG